ncbi:MAG: hypothetical protein ABI563_11135 [Specibacter sp.]
MGLHGRASGNQHADHDPSRCRFWPILSTGNLGAVQIIARIPSGKMPGNPGIGLWIVDVRDLADIRIRAMRSPAAAGERYLGTGEFTWMRELALHLRAGLGAAACEAPTRQLLVFLVRFAALFDPVLRALAVSLGRRNRHSTDKVKRVLD